jgi:hypothetical protein
MSTESMRGSDASIFDRLISRQRPIWVTVGISLLLLLAPIGAAALDGVLAELLRREETRFLFLPPVVIIYILIVAPLMVRTEARVVNALRPVVLIDDESFQRVLDEASRLNPIGEGIAFGAGAAFGLWLGQNWGSDIEESWLGLYLVLSGALMFGLLAWTIYVAVTSTRLTAALHRQPLRIDLFDITPFESVGRQSLTVALAFVVGILLAMVFSLQAETILAWQNWLMVLLLALVPVLVFFLNMRQTHRVLAAEQKRELAAVRQKLLRASRTLIERIDAAESTATLAPEINALAVYEERLMQTRTWPYDTGMLRTLFVSVIIPIVAALGRFVTEIMFD